MVSKKRNKKIERDTYRVRIESPVGFCSSCLASSADAAGMIARNRSDDKPNKRHNLGSLRDSFDLTVRLIGAEMGLPQRGRTHGGSTIAERHSSIDS